MFKDFSSDDKEYNRVMENLAKQYLFTQGRGGTGPDRIVHIAHCQIGSDVFIILLDGEAHHFWHYDDTLTSMRKFLRWNGFEKEDVAQFMAAVKEVWDLTVESPFKRHHSCGIGPALAEWELFSDEDAEHVIIEG